MSEQRQPVLTGGCQCGAIRYAFYAMPGRAGICHCRMCQKAVGGPYHAWANTRIEDFAWTRGTPATFQSSSAAVRSFCPHCGTPLGFSYVKRPGALSMSLGSFDTPEKIVLTQEDGIESRLSNCSAEAIAALPSKPTSEGSPPEDLSHITNYQHPDHDTPPDWRPAG